MRPPEFLIVGAPKSGTTALTRYLSVHPGIFMPRGIELHYFGRDLIKSEKFPRDWDAYMSWFTSASTGQVIGERSVTYLYSTTAAEEISRCNPAAKIIMMLRDPVDMIYALHSQLLFGGGEDIADFREALDAEQDRRNGRRIPRDVQIVQQLFYRGIAGYSEQVERYFDVFGREHVLVILYDDFRRSVSDVYSQTLAFLGVDASYQPEFPVVNPNKRVRSRLLRGALDALPRDRWYGQILVPAPLRWRLARFNRVEQAREPLPAKLRQELQAEFADETRRLSGLLGRDLTHWAGT